LAKALTPSLHTLRRVHLNITSDKSGEDPLAGLCNELEEILEINNLESIEIQMRTDEIRQTGDEWGRLEEVLLKPGWPKLKRVSLAINIYGDFVVWEILALKSLPYTQFTALASSKNFDFHFSVEYKY
jgi:hypothetical protein